MTTRFDRWPRRCAGIVATLLPALCVARVDIFQDWAVACDNTRHCEATGFQRDEDFDFPVSLWLARDAGPATPTHARLTVIAPNGTDPKSVSIRVGSLLVPGVPTGDDAPESEDLARLLPALLDAATAEITDGVSTWTLSLAGIKAALLKIDETQGRVGTRGAWVRKGQRPEAAVPPPLPAPTVRAAPLPAPRPGDDALVAPILAAVALADGDCHDNLPDAEHPETSITRLSATRVLVLRECSRAAYQGDSGAWIANIRPPYLPKRVRFPTPEGEPADTVMNAAFTDGVMSAYMKGRGLADCVTSMSWTWTGAQFALTEASSAPLCRGIPGGGFGLRTWTATTTR
jgi:hypothetical protein